MKTSYKILVIGWLVGLWWGMGTQQVYACDSGLLGWLVGCDPAGLNSASIERNQIDAEKQKRVAEVQSAAAVQIEQARQQVELFKVQDAADERRHQAEMERMQRQFEAYVAMVEAQTQERVTLILADYQTAQLALQEQSDIAISGITGATSVTRTRVVMRGIVTLGLIGLAVVLVVVGLPLLRRQAGKQPMRLQPPIAYRWPCAEQSEVDPWKTR